MYISGHIFVTIFQEVMRPNLHTWKGLRLPLRRFSAAALVAAASRESLILQLPVKNYPPTFSKFLTQLVKG